MNWKEEAVQRLQRYDAMRRAVINLPQEIDLLRQEATAVSTGWVSPVSGSRKLRAREDLLLDNLVKRQQLQWSLDQARGWMDNMNRALSALTPEERLILQQMYILPAEGALEWLSGKLGVERSSIYRRRDKALQKFTLSLYGDGESN